MKRLFHDNKQAVRHQVRHHLFWRAVLEVRNYLFEDEYHDCRARPHSERAGHIFEAVQVLDCWLDVAIEEGWLDSEYELF